MKQKSTKNSRSNIQSNLGRMRKIRVLWIALIVAVLAVVLVAVLAGIDHKVVEQQEAEAESQSELIAESKEAESIAQSLADAETETETEKPTEDPFKNYVSPIDFDELRMHNPDIIAWLSMPGTDIEYPILQSKTDDTYYLNHNINGEVDKNGSLYTEYKYNRDDFSDPVTVVYGHNMASGKMFGLLQEMYSQGFEGRDKAIVYLPDRERTYELFAALPIGEGHLLSGKDMRDEGTYAHFATRLLNSSDFEAKVVDGTQITIGERLLVLSTCIGQQPDKRFIVVGKEVGPTAIDLTEHIPSEELLNLGLLFPDFLITQDTIEQEETQTEGYGGKTIIQQYDKVEGADNSHVQEEDTFVWTSDPDSAELGAGDVISPKTMRINEE